MKLLRIVLAILLILNGLMMGVVAWRVFLYGDENVFFPSFGLIVSVKLFVVVFVVTQLVLGILFNLLAPPREQGDVASK